MTQYQQLIHEYLDGSIEAYQENILFDELARDSSLRREFQEQMALHRTAASDMAAISTPAELGNEVFAAIGISTTPFADVPAKTIASNRTFKTWTSIFTGMFAIVVLYFLTARTEDSFKGNPENSSALSAKNAVPKTGNESQIQPENNADRNVNGNIAENNVSQSSATVLKENSIKNPVSFKNSEKTEKQKGAFKNQGNQGLENDNSAEKFTGIYYVNALPSNSYVLSASANQFASGKTLAQFLNEILQTYPVTVQVNGATSFKSFDNFTIDALYDYSAVDKFGVEAGRESFEQNFTQSVNGELLKTTKLMSGATAGIVYRRLLPQFSAIENLVPFAQIYIGSPLTGGVATVLNKLTAGAMYKANDRIYIILGGEFAATPLSKQYNSRTQMTFGAGINF
ncbi:MAG: hypothetical protein V4642_15585 [Bacteroidota bacterium]